MSCVKVTNISVNIVVGVYLSQTNGEALCHDSVNSKGLFIVRTRLPPRVYSLSP